MNFDPRTAALTVGLALVVATPAASAAPVFNKPLPTKKLPTPVKPTGVAKPVKPKGGTLVTPTKGGGATVKPASKPWPPLTTYARSRAKTKGPGTYVLDPGGPFVLSRFLFQFENGDHELRRLTLQHNSAGNKVTYAFNDYNADDPYKVGFGYIGVNDRGVSRGTVWNAQQLRPNVAKGPTAKERKVLNGACMNGAGYVPLLTGFNFSHSQKDVAVRRLAAICAPETVTQCEGTYGWYTASNGKCDSSGHAKRTAIQTVYRQAWDDRGDLDTDDIEAFFDTKRSTGGKDVRADWLYVPLSAVDECRSFYGRDTRAIENFASGRDVAIQGFDYRFLDTDHHILEVGLIPQGGGGEQVRFRDNDRKDPFEYRVQLCALKKRGRLRGSGVGGASVAGGSSPSSAYDALSFVGSNAKAAKVRGETTKTAGLRGSPLLSSFYFGFHGGDHKIHSVGVEPVGGSVHFTYRDGNGDDDFTARATYYSTTGATLTTKPLISRDEFGAPAYQCDNLQSCVWTLKKSDGVPKKFVPIMSGFAFERKATDANFGKLKAGWYQSQAKGNGRYEAAMTEESGFDWRHGASRIARDARDPRFRGSVVLVPAEKVEKCATVYETWNGKKGASRPGKYDTKTLEPGKKFVLQAVSFSFLDGDHHLQHLGVEYRANGQLRVHFKDDNRDDPYNWSVTYCYLR